MSENEDFILEEKNNVETTEETVSKVILKWYVIHTYSGYENKVKVSIEKIIENRNMYDVITDVVVPVQDVTEITKTGQKKIVSRKTFPGYVFLKMNMNDETWYVVRNTRGVTSFVGPGSKPVALTEDEIITMGIESFVDTCSMNVDDIVIIRDGPFTNSQGVIKEININKKTVIVNVNFFERETPVELDFHQIRQVD